MSYDIEDEFEDELGDEWSPDKSKFKDEKGRYISQGLFLENGYNTDLAVFTYDGQDKEYKGKTYPSLKRLYLEEGDPTEYNFANKYLFDWKHWKRLCNNRLISAHIEEWREELAIALRADGIASLIQSAGDGHYQSAKFLADGGWDVAGRGRPSKEEVEGELKRRADETSEFDDDFELLKLEIKNA